VIFERWGDLIATFPQRRATAQEKYRAWQRAKTDAESRGQLFDQPPPADFWSLENRVRPMGLYGGMIAPLIPYAIRGTAWYQGEQNAGQKHYQASLAALIADWRLKWGEGEFPFLVVQLPNYASGNPAGEAWPRTREAQARVAATLPNVSLAVTIDQGERDSVHPLHKREVGRRLALLTLNKTYGRDIIAEGPVFRKAQFNGSHVDVQLDRAEGLHATSERVSGFELAGSDRKFAPAEAKLTGDGLTVTSPDVSVPIAVRYAWRNAPDTNLYNAAALPLAPFRSDNW
jgi:sialate O-acetylesterase